MSFTILIMRNDLGILSCVENEHMDFLDIVHESPAATAKDVCMKSAQTLRKLADSFEKLADMKELDGFEVERKIVIG